MIRTNDREEDCREVMHIPQDVVCFLRTKRARGTDQEVVVRTVDRRFRNLLIRLDWFYLTREKSGIHCVRLMSVNNEGEKDYAACESDEGLEVSWASDECSIYGMKLKSLHRKDTRDQTVQA